jgi:CBS-domain-containing membrane protein
VLRGLLTYWLGHQRATVVAARIGQGFALAFGLLGIIYDPLLLLVAAFVFLAAEAEIRYAARSRPDRSGPATAGDALMPQLRVLSAGDTVAAALSTLDATTQPAYPVAGAGKRIVGAVTRTRLAEAWAAGAHGAPVETLMRPGLPAIQASTPIAQAYAAVMGSDALLVAVVDDSGQLLGFLSKEHFASMHPKRRHDRPTGPQIPS